MPTAPVDLHDYAVIGNLRTAALVSRFGSIDWACLPDFDSPSVFGALLDPNHGGQCAVRPLGSREVTQRYVPGTNVLASYFVLADGRRLELIDFMPVAPSYVAGQEDRLLRRLRAEGGRVEVEIELDPRFDYGRGPPTTWTLDRGGGVSGRSRDHALRAEGPWRWRRRGPAMVARGAVEPGAAVFLSLHWGEPAPPSDPEVLLSATVRYWRDWVRRPDAPLRRSTDPWREWIERSELLLKLLSNQSTGAFIAAPTTSLPEWPGGQRNWDYRYAWVRDAAFAAQSLLALGHVPEARSYVRWIVERISQRTSRPLATTYRVTGAPVGREQIIGHWEGYARSRPVRIGNAAGAQLQLDIFGEVLDAAEQLQRADPEAVRSAWPRLSRLVEAAAAGWTDPDAGIWEARGPPAHYVHSKVMCWVALDRGIRIATRLGDVRRAARWRPLRAAIRRVILRAGYDEARGTFVQAFDRRELDASVLRIPMTGFLPFDDPRIISTVHAIERELSVGPFVYRYRAPDGLEGPEGAFLLCSFWRVECLARAGERERAIRIFRALLRTASPLRLFSEEYDPVGRRPLGNYPQSFTHIGVLRAARAIGAE